MSEELYTVEAAAERLQLHVKTVLRFIREGRLRAAKVGRGWRIQRSDLDALAGAPAEPARASARATCILDLDDISPEAAQRIASTFGAVRMGREARPEPMSIDIAHDPVRRRLKVVMIGAPADVAGMLQLIQAVAER